MRIFQLTKDVGKEILAYDSHNFRMTRILRQDGNFHVGYARLGEEGVIGYHQARGNQLFIIVQGEGWVRTDTTPFTKVEAGQGVFWEDGEWHETKTENGLQAIIVEGNDLSPDPMWKEAKLTIIAQSLCSL